MRWSAAWVFGAVVAPVAAQSPAPSIGVAAVLVAGDWTFAGLGPEFTVPLGADPSLTGRVVAGRHRGSWAARGEATFEYRIPAARAARRRWYLAGGFAVVSGVRGGPFLQLGVGLDFRRSRQAGPFVELGVGGGFRTALGVRAEPTTQTAAQIGRP